MGHLGLMNTAPAAPNASEAPNDSPGSRAPERAAAPPASPARAAAPPRFDAKFIEDHKLVDRYLDSKLPLKGARELENWCRAHPEYLNKLKLSERAQASLKLLDASGQ